MGFLLQLLYIPVRLLLLPFKLARSASIFLTCGAPILAIVGIAAAAAWFLLMG